ncbi:hypothetical protein ACIRRA_17085 [Nocardia sp. NPDC101769]|uniref:hypothetical protein n=1 Tax=Nocardia sp. NPDC101769 TaxID=3364333 RepID=UPI00382F9A1E
MNVKNLFRKGFGIITLTSAAVAGLVMGAAPASASLVSTRVDCQGGAVDGCSGAYVIVQATTSSPVTIVVNGVTLGGSPFALTPCCSGVNGANYGVTVQIARVDGDQHVVVTQKNADGTTSQQSADYNYSAANRIPGSSGLNALDTFLNGFQTGSSGGHVVPWQM